jgi:hypothetical protein
MQTFLSLSHYPAARTLALFMIVTLLMIVSTLLLSTSPIPIQND